MFTTQKVGVDCPVSICPETFIGSDSSECGNALSHAQTAGNPETVEVVLRKALKKVSPKGAAVMLLGLVLLSAQLFIISSRQAAAADYISYQTVDAGTPEVFSAESFVDPKRVADFLVVAVVQVESDGKAHKVGRAGERGLMQIKRSTWKEVTKKLYGHALPFDLAFDPAINRRVGKAYLAELQIFLQANKARWKSDERSLLLACYNAGPNCVMAAGFSMKRVPASTQSYVERATALHEYYLAGAAARIRNLLLVQNRIPTVDARS
jgi:hypothetical protein